MRDNELLRLVYTFFVGLLLALFVGVGISTFYPAPEAPEWPIELNSGGKEYTFEQQQVQLRFDQEMRAFEEEKSQPYSRNVSIITLVAAVLLLGLSLAFEHKIKELADGVMLGGLFTLLYSIGRGFASNDSKYVFIVITVGLIFILYLGYRRFVSTNKLPKKPAA